MTQAEKALATTNNQQLDEYEPEEGDEDLTSVLIRIANSLEAIALVLVAQEKRWQELDINTLATEDDPYRLS